MWSKKRGKAKVLYSYISKIQYNIPMKTTNQSFEAEFEAKKSVFIAHLCPHSSFKESLNALKSKHPKAVHFVYAFRYLNELGQIVEDKSDDGEPKGTSGLPCLNVLRGAQLVGVAVIVVRYFGGIKLGTGGLVRAYSSAVNAVLEGADLVEFECKKSVNLSLNLSVFSRMEHYLRQNKLEFDKKFSANSVQLVIKASENEQKALLEFAQKLGISL